MKNTLHTFIATSLLLFVISFQASAQNSKPLEIKFLNAAFTDTTASKNLLVIISVKTPNAESFPPEVKLPPKMTVFENGREKVVLLVPQKNLGVRFDGESVKDNKQIYDLVKDKIDLTDLKTTMIITYTIGELNYVFTKMSLTPAFAEKGKPMLRYEERFEFDLK